MSLNIQIASLHDLEQFYAVGERVRNRNNSFELPWSETKDIARIASLHKMEFQLLIGKSDDSEGRLAAFRFKDRPEAGYFGWYECDEDNELSAELLKRGKEWLASVGAKRVGGPMNGSSWGTFRFNIVSDRPLFVTEPYQPLYYVDQWKDAGFVDDVVYETHLIPKTISRPMPRWQVKMFAFIRRIHIKEWPQNMAADEDRLRDMHDFFHECFSENPLYRPITFEQYRETTIKLEEIIDFKHSYLATDRKGKPVSVLISYKDIYHQMYKEGKLKDKAHDTYTLYMKTIATTKKWRGKHISRVLVNFGLVQAYKNGYDEVVFGTMMVNNKSAQYSKSFFEAEALRTYVFLTVEL